jgi:hypothetical protein
MAAPIVCHPIPARITDAVPFFYQRSELAPVLKGHEFRRAENSAPNYSPS